MRVSKGNGFYGKRLKNLTIFYGSRLISHSLKKNTVNSFKDLGLSFVHFYARQVIVMSLFSVNPLRIDAFDQNNTSKRRINILTINEELPQLTIISCILTTLVLDLDVIV